MTGFRASGAIVATYLSVLVTVVIAHVEITEIGMRKDASTINTQAITPRARRPVVFRCRQFCRLGQIGPRRLLRLLVDHRPHHRSMSRPPHTATRRLSGSNAPMIQNSGRKIPMMNITQWPFRMDKTPNVMMSTK